MSWLLLLGVADDLAKAQKFSGNIWDIRMIFCCQEILDIIDFEKVKKTSFCC